MPPTGTRRLAVAGRSAAPGGARLEPLRRGLTLGCAVLAGATLGGSLGWRGAEAAAPVPPDREDEPMMALGLALPAAPPPEEPTPPGRVDRRKRPTPMRPEVAAAYLTEAWTAVLGAPPPVGALSILWAHWALETGRGLWMRDYNFAGIQGAAPDGGSAVWWTSERIDGETQRVRLRFRAYASPEDGARDYVTQLRDRFPRALAAARAGDARAFARELQRATYFTSDGQDYERAVSSLAEEYRGAPLARRPSAPGR